MNITMSDAQFNDTIDDATNAVVEAVNTLLFDHYGKRAYTAEERQHELDVVLAMVELHVIDANVYGNLDVMVKNPYRGDPGE